MTDLPSSTGAERRLHAVVEASAQIPWSADARGLVVEDLPRWRSFTGQQIHELHGDGWLDAVHADDRAAIDAAWRGAIDGRREFEAEYRLLHQPTGTWRWVVAKAVPLDRGDGSLEGWVGMITDIDEQRCAEREVRRLAAALTVAERDERQRIAQVLHDDLQQRLYSLQMRTNLLRERLGGREDADSTVTEALREIEEWLSSSVELSHRLTAEISPPTLESTDLADSLDWLAGHMHDLHDLDVRMEAHGSCHVSNEGLRLSLVQVLRELLFNVVKHADVKEATVALHTTDTDVSIVVTDRGIGSGQGAESAGARSTSGVGLASARERLTLLGGRMEFRSTPHAGTVVTITVPLKNEHP